MSKHRIKSVALEDDYADDYYDDDDQNGYVEDNGMTAEDQERLRVGTVQVRNTLGQGFASITDKEIQDTLWHYYYDISKSVSYLKSTVLWLSVQIEVTNGLRQTHTKPK